MGASHLTREMQGFSGTSLLKVQIRDIPELLVSDQYKCKT